MTRCSATAARAWWLVPLPHLNSVEARTMTDHMSAPMTRHRLATLGLAAAALAASFAATPVSAEEAMHEAEIERQQWSFGGFKGQFDKAQLQRGFQVYKEVCSACHGLSRVNFRNLVQEGGPEFPEAGVKALGAEWPNKITDGPNDEGKMFERPALLSDPILGPYKNEKEARAAQGGALPPDLSLIAKARGVHRDPKWFVHPFLMLGDIMHSYQEGGADYVRALLTGYADAPKDVTITEGKYYNIWFPGRQIGMPPPLSDGVVTYQDGTPPTLDNYSRDVAAFLSWTADPTLDQRKRIGWQVMLYLLVTTGLLYFGKKRIWANIKH
jgi:ubiquinol-cytochrome c reductase cytochrome c1 subunit